MAQGTGTPLQITLYDPETNEEKETYTRTFVPWKLLKEAIRISKKLDADEITEETADELAGLVAAVFGEQFSVKDLDEGADIGEMMTVIVQIVAKAEGVMLNPTPTPGRGPRKK